MYFGKRLHPLILLVGGISAALLNETALAQLQGPDVIVGDIPGTRGYGSLNGIAAFSIATTSCNIGDQDMDWVPSPNPNHPVIAQNLYRVKNGRIEQIGISWLKHGFSVAAGDLCGECQNPATNKLGVGCSDPYGEGLNGSQTLLGPRSQVNASTGAFVLPFRKLPANPGILAGRIQVRDADLDPAQNANATYYVEAEYIHPQDSRAGHSANNASYRPVTIQQQAGVFQLALAGNRPTERMMPAIQAWKAVHADVRLFNVDVPNDGRLILGIRSTQTATGSHNEVALQNLTSDRSVRALTIRCASGTVSAPTFHDVDYHAEDYSGTDWAATANGPAIGWATNTFQADPNANALRWGTLYSFSFDSTAAPQTAIIALFKDGPAGAPREMTVALAPPVPAPVAAIAGAVAKWTADGRFVERDLAGRLSFRVDAAGPDRELSSVTSSSDLFKASAVKGKDEKGTFWTVTLEPAGIKPSEGFETVITLKSDKAGDLPVRIRAFGVTPGP